MKDYSINDEITSNNIRIKGSNEIISKEQALQLARNQNTDLIELSKYGCFDITSVCILENYQKFLYKQKKHEKELKSHQIKTIVKELRFSPQIDKHDYEVKVRQAKKFLKSKAKVKACVIFQGREISYKEQGEKVLLQLAHDLSDISRLEVAPKLEGKKMYITLISK